MADINLLPVEEKGSEASAALQKKFSIAAAAVLIVVAVFGIVTLIMFTNMAQQKQKLLARIDDSTREIGSYKATEELLVVTKEKVSIADKILSGRTDQVNVFNRFAQIVPANVYFTDIKFSSGKAGFSGKAKSSADIAGFISSLASAEGSQIIGNVNIDSLGSDQNGVYTFSVSGELVSPSLKGEEKGSKSDI